jgi:RNA polymerase sigma-70 factor (ECF subfamily)
MSKTSALQELGMSFYQSRSESDFNRLYYQMKPRIGYYLRSYLTATADREEALANTFAKVWAKIHMYDPYWNFSTWIYRIARNEALLMMRHTRRNYSYQEMEENGINMEAKHQIGGNRIDVCEWNLVSIDLLHDKALKEINELPPNYREVMQKLEIEKKKYETISEELGWKLNTVRTRIRKGRALLRKSLSTKYPDLVNAYNSARDGSYSDLTLPIFHQPRIGEYENTADLVSSEERIAEQINEHLLEHGTAQTSDFFQHSEI